MIYQTLIFEEMNSKNFISSELQTVFNNDNLIKELLKDKNVSRFVELSRKLIGKETLTTDEITEFNTLLTNDKVKLYLENIDDLLKKKQFISFSLIGGALALPVLAFSPIAATIAVIGSGILVGTLGTKVAGVLRRWKTIEDYRKWITGMKQNTTNIDLNSNSMFNFNKRFFNEK